MACRSVRISPLPTCRPPRAAHRRPHCGPRPLTGERVKVGCNGLGQVQFPAGPEVPAEDTEARTRAVYSAMSKCSQMSRRCSQQEGHPRSKRPQQRHLPDACNSDARRRLPAGCSVRLLDCTSQQHLMRRIISRPLASVQNSSPLSRSLVYCGAGGEGVGRAIGEWLSTLAALLWLHCTQQLEGSCSHSRQGPAPSKQRSKQKGRPGLPGPICATGGGGPTRSRTPHLHHHLPAQSILERDGSHCPLHLHMGLATVQPGRGKKQMENVSGAKPGAKNGLEAAGLPRITSKLTWHASPPIKHVHRSHHSSKPTL